MRREGNKVYLEEGDLLLAKRNSYRLALIRCDEYFKVGKTAKDTKVCIAKNCDIVAVL